MEVATQQQTALVEAATAVREHAHAPYSDFHVGAALLTADGDIFTGVNVENASYGLTICAERSAVVKMVTAGQTHIKAVAVATENGVTPCGACRQVLAEFAADVPVWVINTTSGEVRQTSLHRLLPDSFDNGHLPSFTHKT